MPSLSSQNDVRIKVSTEGDSSGIDGVSSKFEGMVKNFSAGMKKVSVVTGVAGAALTAYAKSSVDYLQDVVKESKTLATQTGMTVEQSSQLLAVTKRLGINAETTSGSFRILSKQITDARENIGANSLKVEELNNKIASTKLQINLLTAEQEKNGDSTGLIKNKIEALNIELKQYEAGLKSSTNALTKLGIATQKVDGTDKNFNEILLEVSDKFKAMPDGAEKTATALELFGRSGASLIKVLNKGSDGIAELQKRADELGLTLTTKNIDAVAKYSESQKKLAETTNSLKMAVGELTAPILTKFNTTLNDLLLKLIAVDSPFRGLVANTLAFGGPILGAISGTAAFLANIGDAIVLINKLNLAMKMEAGLRALYTLTYVTLPGVVSSLAVTSAAWTAAFPIAGILADIALVAKAVQTVIGAWHEVDEAEKSAKAAGDAQTQTHNTLLNLKKNGTPEQKARAEALLKKGYATGTNNAPSGWAVVGENGPEAIRFRGGEQVKTAGQSSNMGSGGGVQNHFHGNIMLGDESAVKRFFRETNQDSLLARKGLTLRQGNA